VLSAGAQTTLIATGSVWKYYDSGAFPGTNWQRTSFDDRAWAAGRAQLGWGDGDEATAIAFGAEPKPITTYFRHTFVASNASFPTLTMRLAWDDAGTVFGLSAAQLRARGSFSHSNALRTISSGTHSNAQFGFSVAGTADVDGDGFSDVLAA
jgi:hypothetical protein